MDQQFVPNTFDQIAFMQRGFPFPEIRPATSGFGFVASTTKVATDANGVEVVERAELLARSPEIAVHQLARLLNQKEGRA